MRSARNHGNATRSDREPLHVGPFNPGTRHPKDWRNRWAEMVEDRRKVTLPEK